MKTLYKRKYSNSKRKKSAPSLPRLKLYCLLSLKLKTSAESGSQPDNLSIRIQVSHKRAVDFLLRQMVDFEKNILKEVINNDAQLYVILSDTTFGGKLAAIVSLVFINRAKKCATPTRSYICG